MQIGVLGRDQVRGGDVHARGQRPQVQVVYLLDALDRGEIGLDGGRIDALRACWPSTRSTDRPSPNARTSTNAPMAQAATTSHPAQPVQLDQGTGEQHAHRTGGVPDHLEVGPADVEGLLRAGPQQQGRHHVDGQPDQTDDDHHAGHAGRIRVGRIPEPADRLHQRRKPRRRPSAVWPDRRRTPRPGTNRRCAGLSRPAGRPSWWRPATRRGQRRRWPCARRRRLRPGNRRADRPPVRRRRRAR